MYNPRRCLAAYSSFVDSQQQVCACASGLDTTTIIIVVVVMQSDVFEQLLREQREFEQRGGQPVARVVVNSKNKNKDKDKDKEPIEALDVDSILGDIVERDASSQWGKSNAERWW